MLSPVECSRALFVSPWAWYFQFGSPQILIGAPSDPPGPLSSILRRLYYVSISHSYNRVPLFSGQGHSFSFLLFLCDANHALFSGFLSFLPLLCPSSSWVSLPMESLPLPSISPPLDGCPVFIYFFYILSCWKEMVAPGLRFWGKQWHSCLC